MALTAEQIMNNLIIAQNELNNYLTSDYLTEHLNQPSRSERRAIAAAEREAMLSAMTDAEREQFLADEAVQQQEALAQQYADRFGEITDGDIQALNNNQLHPTQAAMLSRALDYSSPFDMTTYFQQYSTTVPVDVRAQQSQDIMASTEAYLDKIQEEQDAAAQRELERSLLRTKSQTGAEGQVMDYMADQMRWDQDAINSMAKLLQFDHEQVSAGDTQSFYETYKDFQSLDDMPDSWVQEPIEQYAARLNLWRYLEGEPVLRYVHTGQVDTGGTFQEMAMEEGAEFIQDWKNHWRTVSQQQLLNTASGVLGDKKANKNGGIYSFDKFSDMMSFGNQFDFSDKFSVGPK